MWYIQTSRWGFYAYARRFLGPWLSERSSQNTEPHDDTMSFDSFWGISASKEGNSILLTGFQFSLSAFKLKRQRESFRFNLCSSNKEEQPNIISHKPLCPQLPPLLYSTALCILTSFVSCVLSSSSSSPGWKQVCLVFIFIQVEQRPVIRSVFTGSTRRLCRTIIQVPPSQKILIVQEFGVLARLPKSVEAEIEVHLNHLFALSGKWDGKRRLV